MHSLLARLEAVSSSPLGSISIDASDIMLLVTDCRGVRMQPKQQSPSTRIVKSTVGPNNTVTKVGSDFRGGGSTW